MSKFVRTAVAAMFGLSFILSVQAADPKLPPNELVVAVSNEVIDKIRSNADLAKANPASVNELVDKNILPYSDFTTMTRMAVGPSWRKATEAQKSEILKLFRQLLVSVYSGALKEASEYKVELRKGRPETDPRLALVRTNLVAKNRDPITLDYRLLNQDGQWKIFDVNVGGVWLVENYRSQFASVINNKGISGLIASLRDRVK